ncbi:MAG: MFS transporter [Thermodesulfobacteriota bacterium]
MRRPYYGWIIVGVSFLIGVTEAGVFQNILSIFMKPMAQDFGWSRAAVTGAIAVGSMCGGLVSPFVGPIVDRYGPRMVAFWGILLFSMGLSALMFVKNIWQLYLFFGMGRMIAVGVLSLVVTVSVSNWFIRQRGRALGITWIGERAGSALLPVMIQFLILAYGWRMAWGTLGVVVFLMSGIPALLFLRRRPEDMGLLPDGAASTPAIKRTDDPLKPPDRTAADEAADPVWTRAQATHTKTFWTLTLITCLIPFLQAGINFHIYPFMTDQGLSQKTAVWVLSTIAVFGALGSVPWGMLADRVHIQTLLAVNVFGNGLVFLLLFWTVRYKLADGLGTGMIFVLAALHGILHGGRNTLVSLIWAVFFGRTALGSIYGFSIPFKAAANACGPIFAAVCFDLFGSYAFPFYLFAALFIITGAISIRMKPPERSAQKPAV